jgi:hypothetical protein
MLLYRRHVRPQQAEHLASVYRRRNLGVLRSTCRSEGRREADVLLIVEAAFEPEASVDVHALAA